MDLWAASYVVLWIVVAALVFLVMGLLRQLGLIQLRLGIDPGVLITPEGLERGSQAPDFEAVDVQTERLTRATDFRGRRLILIFLSPNCLACRELIPHLNEFANERRSESSIVVICYGMKRSCAEFRRMFRLELSLLADPENKIAVLYQVRATPFAFLIDENGLVRIRGVVNSWMHLDALLKEEGTIQTTPWRANSPVATSEAMHSSAGPGDSSQ
jgi:methylamine dehydrogenase accessory protein MauD